MVGWHHWLGHEFEQAPGDGDEQGSLVCCSPWGQKESDTTEQLNWTEALFILVNTKQPSKLHRKTNIIQNHSSVQFSHSVMPDYLRPHGLQHARPPCPSLIPGACSNSCPSSRWCHPTISSSVIPFSSCFQSFPASGSFQTSQLFISGGQSTGVSASTSVLPMNIQDWFPLGWNGWISLSRRDSQESSPTPQFKSINSLALSFFYSPTLTSIHDYWKNHSFD